MKVIELFRLLMQPGYYLRQRVGNSGPSFCLYSDRMVPVRIIPDSGYKKIKYLLRKQKKYNALVLDRRAIRSLHGNSSLKREYKALLKATTKQ